MIRRLKRHIISRLKIHFREVMKAKTKPHEIALGFAIGTLIEFLVPVPFADFIIAFIIISIFERVSKFSLFGALLFWNALITWPLLALSLKIGNFLYGSEPVMRYKIEFLNNVYNFTKRILVGNVIIGGSLAFLSYFIIKFITKKYQTLE